MSLFNFKIKGRLILICTALVLIPLISLGITFYINIAKEISLENEIKLKQQAQLIALNTENIYEIALKQVKIDLNVARSSFYSFGQPVINEDGHLVIQDEENNRVHKIEGDYEIVDNLQSIIGGTATIFQLKRFEGEKSSDPGSRGWSYNEAFYRISTNVIKDDGTRAIGTILSKPVHDSIKKGKTFYGRAWVVNAWYMTAYEPIYDDFGRIIGILYIGVKESEYQETLLNNLVKQKVGKTGYIGILNSDGDYVLSLNRDRDGENIIEAKDSEGNYFIRNIIDSALGLNSGETGLQYYSWKNTGESQAREKFAAYSYFPAWDWIILPNAYVDDFQDSLFRMRDILLIFSIIAGLVGILVSYLFADSIAKPLKKVASMANEISRGNLNVEHLQVKRNDEIAMLAHSFTAMIDSFRYKADAIQTIADGDLTRTIEKASDEDQLGQSLIEMNSSLNNLLQEITQTVVEVNNGADHVSNAGQMLSQGAVEQASSLEEISSALNKINGQSKQNANSALEASSLAKTAAANAEKGNTKMDELLEAMTKINESSNDISKIVKVIDDIAFQINLLALNANVEAARAGKYGKGFAVVADEVRSLANRSADAAKETSAMVEASGKNVNLGKTAAEGTAEELKEILTGTVKVSEFLMEISRSSTEQAEGVNDINVGLEQIDQVTQSNSSSAEESASAGEELAAQAAQLRGMLEQFKLSDQRRAITQNPTLDEERELIGSGSY